MNFRSVSPIATRSILLALPIALSIACGSAGSATTPASGSVGSVGSVGSASDDTAATHVLDGTYVSVGHDDSAEFARISFTPSGTYSYVRGADRCSGSCTGSGSYTFDGVKMLTLTDGASGTVESVVFAGVKSEESRAHGVTLAKGTTVRVEDKSGDDDDDDDSSKGAMPAAGSGSSAGSGGSLTMAAADGGLIDPTTSALLSQIVEAIVAGALMALENQDAGASGDDDDGGSANVSPCASPAVVATCLALGGSYSGDAGSCSCALPDAGTP